MFFLRVSLEVSSYCTARPTVSATVQYLIVTFWGQLMVYGPAGIYVTDPPASIKPLIASLTADHDNKKLDRHHLISFFQNNQSFHQYWSCNNQNNKNESQQPIDSRPGRTTAAGANNPSHLLYNVHQFLQFIVVVQAKATDTVNDIIVKKEEYNIVIMVHAHGP